jgi:hypothetical protein
MSDQKEEKPGGVSFPWWNQLKASLSTLSGMVGVWCAALFFIFSVLGLIGHVTGLVSNPYISIITIIIFPGGMVLGVVLVLLAYLIDRRKFGLTAWRKNSGKNPQWRSIVMVLVFSAILPIVVGFKAHSFLGSPLFCGKTCHRVMEPDFVTHNRSPHARVECIDCHATPGLDRGIRANLAGARRLQEVIAGKFNRPLAASIADLPSAKRICEKCHSPEKYFGAKVKTSLSFSNDDQENPEHQEIILNIGGRNPQTNLPEGIHFHTDPSLKIEYQPLDEKRTKIGNIRVTRAGEKPKEYTIQGESGQKEASTSGWRTMDCTDCHNRTAHVFDNPVERVDFGLNRKMIDPLIPGIREDSLTVLYKEYADRPEAGEKIPLDLITLQEKRNGGEFVKVHRSAIIEAGAFLVQVYQANIWPRMMITWGTYKDHGSHRYNKTGYGCFRCHDDKHQTKSGETVSQDCGLCHLEPE